MYTDNVTDMDLRKPYATRMRQCFLSDLKCKHKMGVLGRPNGLTNPKLHRCSLKQMTHVLTDYCFHVVKAELVEETGRTAKPIHLLKNEGDNSNRKGHLLEDIPALLHRLLDHVFEKWSFKGEALIRENNALQLQYEGAPKGNNNIRFKQAAITICTEYEGAELDAFRNVFRDIVNWNYENANAENNRRGPGKLSPAQ